MNELNEIYESEILLTESKNPYIIGHLTCDAAEGEIATKNNNTYSTALLKRESGALNKRIEKSGVLGCLEHPPTFNSPLNKASHIITKSKMKGNKMEIESAVLNTPSGKAFWAILNSGIKHIGASIRGAGTRAYDGKIKDDYRLSSIDFVSAPAAECATLDASNIIESYVPTELDEAFFSLRNELSTAVKEKFGKDYWIVDFSPKEVVFRKDGSTEEEYQKISYQIKGKEINLTGDAETVKKAVQYEEDKMKEDEIKKEAVLYRKWEEAVESGYKGNFEQYKEMAKDRPPEKTDRELLESAARNGNLEAQKELAFLKGPEEREAKRNKVEDRRFYEAQDAGFMGTRKEWRKLIQLGEARRLLEEAAHNPESLLAEVDKAAEAAKKQLKGGLSNKEKLEAYHQDLKDEEFEGSFWDWLQLKEKEAAEHLKKELKALEELSS